MTCTFLLSACENLKCYNHEPDLLSLKLEYQKTLDTGIEMLNTDREFSGDTDSVLNLVISEFEKVNRQYWHSILKPELKRFKQEKKQKLDSLWSQGETIFKETGIWPELKQEIWYGTSADYNYQKAIELNRIKLEMCDE
jgi:hypothetical protein